MDENEKVVIEVNKQNLVHQGAKLVLATAAGFIASKLAESAYDHFVNRNDDPAVEVQQ